MNQKRLAVRILFSALMISCMVGAAASAASASISIEPLNTAFTSEKTSALILPEGNAGECKSFTISGKTAATKSNSVSVTPTFGECFFVTTWTLNPAFKCKVKGTVPWKLTLTGAEGAKEGGVELASECEMLISEEIPPPCEHRVPAQTVKAGSWREEGGKLHIYLHPEFTNIIAPSRLCEMNGLTYKSLRVETVAVIGNISA